jgi:GntR family transcriptional regulator, phosphonate transport system regulatory protein
MAAPRRGEVPLYQRVRTVLLDRIGSGEYAPGDRLPSEGVLAEDLGVHRLTVRRALDELSREGLLRARQGSGTFVSPRPEPIAITIPLTPEEFSSSLRAMLRSQGQHYRDVLLATDLDDDDAVRRELELPHGRLRRVESALEVDGEMWVCSTAWAPDEQLADVEARWRESDGLYGLLLDRRGRPLRYVWRSFAAEAATAGDAAVLGIRPGAPVLVREGLTADEDGRPVLRVRRRARADRVRYLLDYSKEPEAAVSRG